MTLPRALPTLPFYHQRNASFAVRRLICIGRNYAEHAKEMGHNPQEAPPFFFYKPLTALYPVFSAPNNTQQETPKWCMPRYSHNVHHEIEICVAIGNKLTPNDLEQPDKVNNAIVGFGIALDMTCRDSQQTAKHHGRPWDTAKGFDDSAPCSGLMAGNWQTLQQTPVFSLHKNGQQVQQGNLNDMIWPVPELLAEVSRYTQLDAGDLILTGTPAGVGPVISGDTLSVQLHGTPCQFNLAII